MMAESSELMLRRVFGSRLNNATSAGTNVYTGSVPKDVARPYLLITIPVNVERNWHHRKQDPSVVVQIKAVSADETEALVIRQEAIELVDQQGEQDPGGMSGGADWHLLTVNVTDQMSNPYMVGTTRIFEKIAKVHVTLEEK